MEVGKIDILEFYKILFDTYSEKKNYTKSIKEKGYICFFAPADYAEFVLLIKEEGRYLPNAKRATMNDTIPFVVEYARGFTEGYTDFEKIIDNSVYKEEKDKTERIWSIICSPNFGSICSAYDIEDKFSLDKKLYLSMELMFKQGKEAGIYYKALKTINDNPSKFEEFAKGLKPTSEESKKEKPQQFSFDTQEVKEVYEFCIETDVIKSNLSEVDFLNYVTNANFTDVYVSSKKTKFKYIIFQLSYLIADKKWYSKAADSIGVKPSRCSAATNLPFEWKKEADKLRKGIQNYK